MPPSSSVPRRSSLHRVDRHDNALRRFDDLAGIQAQIFAKARRQDRTPGRKRPVAADRHRKRRNPQQRANVAMLKAGGKCSGFVRDRASRSRPQMSSAWLS